MDTIILAAGTNTRLQGIVAPYHKPLLVIDGKPLIYHIVSRCISKANEKIIAVVAPGNVAQICGVLETHPRKHQLRYIVQPTPIGPVDALMLGLELTITKLACFACGDNIIPKETWDGFRDLSFSNKNPEFAIALRTVSSNERSRYTSLWRHENGKMFFEHNFNDHELSVAHIGSWIGPVVIQPQEMKELYAAKSLALAKNQRFSALFNCYLDHYPTSAQFVKSTASDIGVPEVMP